MTRNGSRLPHLILDLVIHQVVRIWAAHSIYRVIFVATGYSHGGSGIDFLQFGRYRGHTGAAQDLLQLSLLNRDGIGGLLMQAGLRYPTERNNAVTARNRPRSQGGMPGRRFSLEHSVPSPVKGGTLPLECGDVRKICESEVPGRRTVQDEHDDILRTLC